MSRVNILMSNCDEDLDRDVDSIIFQIKNQGKSLKNVEKEKPELKKEDIERFILENASAVVLDSVEMVQSLKQDVMAGGDSKMVESISELVKATTGALETLSRMKMADDKLKGQKELKQMDIDAKINIDAPQDSPGIFLSREELLKHLFVKKDEKKIEDNPAIDV